MTPEVVSGKDGGEDEGGGKKGEREMEQVGEAKWKIVKYTFSVSSGEPLSWGERCRIKHLPTRKYLAIIYSAGEYKVFKIVQAIYFRMHSCNMLTYIHVHIKNSKVFGSTLSYIVEE